MNENRPVVQTRLPSVDRVLRTPTGQVAAARFGHAATINAIRTSLAALRAVIRSKPAGLPDASAVANAALQFLQQEDTVSLRRVFQSHRTVLHTEPGPRGPSRQRDAAAVDAMRSAGGARVRCRRRRRAASGTTMCVALIRELTGAEDAAISTTTPLRCCSCSIPSVRVRTRSSPAAS